MQKRADTGHELAEELGREKLSYRVSMLGQDLKMVEVLQRAAQAADPDIDGALVDRRFLLPQTRDQILAAEHAVGIFGEEAQQAELVRPQGQSFAIPARLQRTQIDHQSAQLDDAGDAVLLNGAAAQVAVSVATADGVVVIPISALHRSDAGDTVSVLDGGELVTVPVEVGAIGTDLVEIISGIAVGDEVVIADLTAATEEATAETTGLADLGGTTEETGAEFGGTPPDFGGGPPAGAGGR